VPGGVGHNVRDPQDETLARLENKLEALGIGYSRMELCVVELCRQIQSLVEQNAQLIEILQPEAEEDVPQYLGSKRR